MMRRFMAVVGPGIFAIGYTIGTGSVTSMAKAGSQYGLQLVWVLFLSCLFSGVLMEAYGRFAVVTGETALFGIRRRLPGGKPLAWSIFVGITGAQYTCLGGILMLSAGALSETMALFFPGREFSIPLIAGGLITGVYLLLLTGRYSVFEKILALFVALMGATFLVSMFVVLPPPEVLKQALTVAVPHEPGALLMIAAFVGTTMAAPTFVTRPLLLKANKQTSLSQQTLDSIVSVVLMFIISGSIMAVAAGTLFVQGKEIVKILDMTQTLVPVAGKFAAALFMVGTISAGLSSAIPILMVAPILLSDYRKGEMEPESKQFRVIALFAACFAMLVPILGRNPVLVTVAAQISNVFVLPLTILAPLLLLNGFGFPREHRAGIALNIGLAAALVFSLAIAFTGVTALLQEFAH